MMEGYRFEVAGALRSRLLLVLAAACGLFPSCASREFNVQSKAAEPTVAVERSSTGFAYGEDEKDPAYEAFKERKKKAKPVDY